MPSRRAFIKQALGGSAALVASGLFPPGRVLGANDRVRIGLIGGGDRGQEILKAALRCPNVEGVAVADVYTRRLDEVKEFVPNIKTYRDFRQLLDDKTVDAVLIATPQHQHALNFVPAIQAGKDVYQEKTMAFNPDHAKRMREAFEKSGRVVQVGIQSTSGPAVEPLRNYLKPDKVGVITAIHTHMFRNAPYGGWKRPIPPDCDPQHVNWKEFQGEAPPHAWDPNRYVNWRFFWDYDGGNVFENMVHQVGFWYKMLNLQIPRAVTMTGNNFLSPDMQPPDTMDVSMDQPEKILFTWNSMFGNRHYGETEDELLGNKGTVSRDENEGLKYTPEGEGDEQPTVIRATKESADGISTSAHMQNFFDCVRNRKEPNCPFEIGFRSAVACQMAVASYRRGRTVHWDEKNTAIV
jgi:predicted dehydrogenase